MLGDPGEVPASGASSLPWRGPSHSASRGLLLLPFQWGLQRAGAVWPLPESITPMLLDLWGVTLSGFTGL